MLSKDIDDAILVSLALLQVPRQTRVFSKLVSFPVLNSKTEEREAHSGGCHTGHAWF